MIPSRHGSDCCRKRHKSNKSTISAPSSRSSDTARKPPFRPPSSPSLRIPALSASRSAFEDRPRHMSNRYPFQDSFPTSFHPLTAHESRAEPWKRTGDISRGGTSAVTGRVCRWIRIPRGGWLWEGHPAFLLSCSPNEYVRCCPVLVAWELTLQIWLPQPQHSDLASGVQVSLRISETVSGWVASDWPP